MITQYPKLDVCIVTTDQLCLAVSLKPNSFHMLTSYHTYANYPNATVKCFLAITLNMQQWLAI